MLSPKLLDKWNKILEKKYKQKNLTKQDAFEMANTLTSYFELLIKFNNEDKTRNDARNNNKKS